MGDRHHRPQSESPVPFSMGQYALPPDWKPALAKHQGLPSQRATQLRRHVASQKVFAITELLRDILRHASALDLFVRFQFVNTQWKAVAAEFLYGQPYQGQSSTSPGLELGRPNRVVNPLLLPHFAPMFQNGACHVMMSIVQADWHGPACMLLDLPIASTDNDAAVHHAFARKGASWRDLQVYLPPVHRLSHGYNRRWATTVYEGGVRMGDVYDLVVKVATRAGTPSTLARWLGGLGCTARPASAVASSRWRESRLPLRGRASPAGFGTGGSRRSRGRRPGRDRLSRPTAGVYGATVPRRMVRGRVSDDLYLR